MSTVNLKLFLKCGMILMNYLENSYEDTGFLSSLKQKCGGN